ncbi:1-acylglycerol-3-phosphate O-acyltransferase, partial [Dispira parvispora]
AALKYYPPLGSFMMLANNIFINRSNRQGAVQTFKAAVDQIHQKKVSVYIFPEGTRGRLGDGQLLPFKKGAFHMAIQAGIPIVPVVFSNYSSFYNPKHHYFTGGTVQIQVLPPITTEGLTTEDVDQLSTSTRDQMTHALVKLLEEQKKNI